MKTITETTKLKNATWVKILHDNIEIAIIWADKIEVEELSHGKHYIISDGENGIVGFAYTSTTIRVNDTCVIESPVNQEAKFPDMNSPAGKREQEIINTDNQEVRTHERTNN